MDATDSTRAEWVQSALRQFEGPLLRYATQLTGDAELARDLAQDTFLRLCAEDPREIDDHLAAWLFTVCRNRARDVMRKENRMTPIEPLDLEARPGTEPSPDAAAELNESTRQVLRLVGGLPPNQREVIRLKFQNGFSYEEISRVTNLSVGNVGFLLHTAIKSIRRQLQTEARSTPHSMRNTL